MSPQRSALRMKSRVLVSKVLTGITGIETQIIDDERERGLWQQLADIAIMHVTKKCANLSCRIDLSSRQTPEEKEERLQSRIVRNG